MAGAYRDMKPSNRRKTAIHTPNTNALLAALPRQDYLRVMDFCETVSLDQDQVLAKPGGRHREVYFPIDGFIVRFVRAPRTRLIGVGLVGREGVLGASTLLGIDNSATHARVAGPGTALRMASNDLQRLLAESPLLEQQLHRYLYLRLREAQQTTACAVFHVLEKRLAYWLLMLHDRVPGDRIQLTHERLAQMLGVRRSGVSTAAGLLQKRKLISYSRGHIVILNRRGLSRAACACYRRERSAAREVFAAEAERKMVIVPTAIAS